MRITLVPLTALACCLLVGAAEVDDLVAKLQKGKTAKDKIVAAEAIGKLGVDGKEAAGPLCQALLDLTPSVRVAAMEAIEKVRPDLYKPLVTLIAESTTKTTTTTASKNAIKAVHELGLLGEEAKPAVPVILARLRAELAAGKVNEVAPEPRDYAKTTLAGACFDSIELISPNDVETQKILLVLGGPTNRSIPARAAALKSLGRMGETDETFRKKALPVVLAGLGVTDKQNRIQLEAIAAVSKFGKDAKDALPVLKKLKLATDEKVREAATAALDKLE